MVPVCFVPPTFLFSTVNVLPLPNMLIYDCSLYLPEDALNKCIGYSANLLSKEIRYTLT